MRQSLAGQIPTRQESLGLEQVIASRGESG